MDLESIKKKFEEEVTSVGTEDALEALRVRYLGRSGEVTACLRGIKDLPLEKRREIGPRANTLKDLVEKRILEKKEELSGKGKKTFFDATKPGVRVGRGHMHPLSIVDEEVRRIFSSLNFSVVEGPEVESEYYNFDALNIPANHPARDMWDTFWLKGGKEKLLMRTHTSPMQIRYMEKHNPPFQIIVPGRVFRYEATDASHETNFYQVEGLMVGPDVTLANFKFIVEEFFKRFFKKEVEFRFRPSYFPFVEPGLEVDIRFQDGKWLEIMGAGMVHRNVFNSARYNPEEIQGFAFGMGLDRLAMIKYKIPDIRLFYSGDVRFTDQF